MNGIREFLELSAPIARRAATQMCRRDPATGESCAWTHGFWQYLRLMGLASGPVHHAGFFLDALSGVTGGAGAPRVLISGSADYSMLAHVLAAFRRRDIEADITVVDQCDTPLEMNRWYAERVGCTVRTHLADVMTYVEPRTFDAICTHSFLSYFPRERRPDLLAKWRSLLRVGGSVITVNAVRPGGASDRVGFDRNQAQAFHDHVLNRAKEMQDVLRLDPLELAAEAATYARKLAFWRVQSSEEVGELFRRSGFEVDRLYCAPVTSATMSNTTVPNAPSAVTGPTSPAKTDYAHVVAVRE